MKEKMFKSLSLFSVFVTIFAVIAGVIFYGNVGVSYAAGDTFTFRQEKEGTTPIFATGEGTSGNFRVPIYYADSTNGSQIFCVQHAVLPHYDASYQKNGQIDDYGLLYLLNNSAVNNVTIVGNHETNKYVETWITQTAIWLYLFEKYPNDAGNAMDASDVAAIKAATKITVNVSDLSSPYDVEFSDLGSGKTIYTEYVKPLVDNAKSASNARSITVTRTGDGKTFTKSQDGSYYESEEITVKVTGALSNEGYSLSASGIEGITMYDLDGKQITGNLTATEYSFKLRIPADKVKEQEQTITVTATGNFNTLSGSYYVATDTSSAHQKVVSVTGTTTSDSNSTTLSIIKAPDTGMNAAQTIYFIGLIVLLCGVGIIYANTKPVEIRQ